jgi:CelD/BcsL family acetyltransferase involved in cellulose biosynthesis
MELTLHRIFPDEIKNEWNTLLESSTTHVPFLRHEYLSTWWQTRGGGEWGPDIELVVVSGNKAGKLAGIAPLFFTPDHEGKPSLMLLGSIEISDYLDLIVSQDDLAEFVDELLPFLRNNLPNWEILDLYNILDGSPTLGALEDVAGQRGWRCRVEKLQHSPYIALSGNWETYLAGIDKKQRHEIRRKMRRAQESGQTVSYILADDSDKLDAEINDLLALMRQDPEKNAFLTAAMVEHMRMTIHCAFEAGCLHLAFLEINGQKAAAHLSFDYLNRIWAYNSGVDCSMLQLSPGWVLLGYELQWANEQKYCEYDFMRGNEDYKYRFGAVDRFVMRVTLAP